MKRWILAAAAVGLGALVVPASGVIPLKASSGHWPVTEAILHFSMERSVATWSSGIEVPPLDEPALVVRGAGHYDRGCRSCHGAPGSPQAPMATGMLPCPPELSLEDEHHDDEDVFYVVKHGVKFTGMPAWPAQDRDDEVWAMVAFLPRAPNARTLVPTPHWSARRCPPKCPPPRAAAPAATGATGSAGARIRDSPPNGRRTSRPRCAPTQRANARAA